MDRRRFLALTAAAPFGLVPLGAGAFAQVAPRAAPRAPVEREATTPVPHTGARWDRTLVLVELHGGNDGLNTVVPFDFGEYYRRRPTLAVARDKAIQIDPRLGLNPAFEPLLPLWRERRIAIILGVGYPKPNLSHFRSIEIWDTASDSNTFRDEGWVARLMASAPPPASLPADAIVLGRDSAGPFEGPKVRLVNLRDRAEAFRTVTEEPGDHAMAANPALAHVLKVRAETARTARAVADSGFETADPGAKFPNDPFGQQLEAAAKLLASGLAVPAIKVALGGFDTHANQAGNHNRLLAQLASGLAAFAAALKAKGLWDRVLVMTYSEFGRRLAENGSRGTDHGTAAPHFVLGGKVKGGFYGSQPSLLDLDAGNLRFAVHFRSLYATAARAWWGMNADEIAERPLPLLA